MPNKYSPESQNSPLLMAAVAVAGTLLLLDVIHYHFRDIILSLHQGVHSAPAVVLLLVLILVLVDPSALGSLSPRAGDEAEREGHYEQRNLSK